MSAGGSGNQSGTAAAGVAGVAAASGANAGGGAGGSSGGTGGRAGGAGNGGAGKGSTGSGGSAGEDWPEELAQFCSLNCSGKRAVPCGSAISASCENDCVDSFEMIRLAYCGMEIPALVDCVTQNPTNPMFACNAGAYDYLGPCDPELDAANQCANQ